MEKRRSIKLVTLLIQYAVSFLFAVFFSMFATSIVINLAMNTGFVLPANTAELEVKDSIKKLKQVGSFDPSLITPRCEYTIFSKDGDVIETSLKGSALDDAKNYYRYGINGATRYHTQVILNEETCVFQYGFYTFYSNEILNENLPDFQIICGIGTGICILILFLIITIYYSKKIKKHILPLTLSAEQLANGDLEKPFEVSGIKEFDEVMQSMDKLRTALKDSMIEKWQMEQDRRVQTAALVHDIKTPITVISGNAELLAESARTDEQIICSNVIVKNALLAERYIEKLRQLSMSEDLITYKKEVVDGNTFINEIKKSTVDICKIRRINLNFNAADLASIYIDREAILRCVINIVENACRFTKEEDTITISIKENTPYLQILVEDAGPGFTKEALKHATDLFYTENGNRNPAGHSGIGLAYSKKVALLHGGRLVLSNSNEGHGIVLLEIETKERDLFVNPDLKN